MRSRLPLFALTGVLALVGTGIAVAAVTHDAARPAAAAGSGHGSGSGGAAGGDVVIPGAPAPGSSANAAVTVTSGTAPAGGGGGPAGAGSGTTGGGETKSVSYLGHTFAVPADWSVVDLSKDPNACVRFDVHAIYLGDPSSNQDCAAQSPAPVEGAIVVQPAVAAAGGGTAGTTASAVDSPIDRRITATLPNAKITAAYGDTDRAEVVGILTGGGVPEPAVQQSAVTTSAARSAVRANLVPVSGPITPGVVALMTGTDVGLGFDACDAPSTTAMTAWASSPYSTVGVYFGGGERACGQANLTASWVTTETAAGWHLLPLYVGPQITNDQITASTDPAAQGKTAADDAATKASGLGIGAGAVLYYDMEGGSYTAAQDTAAQQFISAWTAELHALGYKAAVYGNENGAQGAMLSAIGQTGVTEPDVIDVANWNGEQNDDPGSDPNNFWALHRVHQFEGGTVDGQPDSPTYGGVTINIDQDYFGLGVSCIPSLPTVIVPRSMICEKAAD